MVCVWEGGREGRGEREEELVCVVCVVCGVVGWFSLSTHRQSRVW